MICTLRIPLRYADINCTDILPGWIYGDVIHLTHPRGENTVELYMLESFAVYVVDNLWPFAYTNRDVYKDDQYVTFENFIPDDFQNELSVYNQDLQNAFSGITVSYSQ